MCQGTEEGLINNHQEDEKCLGCVYSVLGNKFNSVPIYAPNSWPLLVPGSDILQEEIK